MRKLKLFLSRKVVSPDLFFKEAISIVKDRWRIGGQPGNHAGETSI